MAWRSYLHAVLRHPDQLRILLLRSHRDWRLPRVLVREAVWVANAAAAAGARPLGRRDEQSTQIGRTAVTSRRLPSNDGSTVQPFL